jgi:hypothetical protein
MAEQLHPAAAHNLPAFITPPGDTDVLMVGMAIFLGLSVVGFGVFYFRLHALPEHIAHKGQKVQFEIVALLALISLFTHMHIFWIAGLLLAFVELPDFTGFLGRIAGSVERMAGVKHGAGADGVPSRKQMHEADADHADSPVITPPKPVRAVAVNTKEPGHA